MDVKLRNFPYPIISDKVGDYSSNLFQTDVLFTQEGQVIKFDFQYKLNNTSLLKLIRESEAKVIFHVECSGTSFRKIYELVGEKKQFAIDARNLNGKVEISSFIVATKKIVNFSDDDFSNIFKGFTFDFEVGSILGVGNQFAILIEKEIEDLTNVASIFKLIKSPQLNQIEYEVGNKQVAIYLPEEDFEAYFTLRQQLPLQSVLSSMIIIPVLTSILIELQNSDQEELESYEDKNWFRSLSKQFKEKFEIDIPAGELKNQSKSMLNYAQNIIGRPTSVGLQTLLLGYSEINFDEEED